MSEVLHEDWKDYTVEEINKVKEEKCRGCEYSAVYGNGEVWGMTCNYILQTGKRRPTRPENCELWR